MMNINKITIGWFSKSFTLDFKVEKGKEGGNWGGEKNPNACSNCGELGYWVKKCTNDPQKKPTKEWWTIQGMNGWY